MSSYILVDRRCPDKKWWNEIVRACAIVGDIFEIHCWSDEHAETKAALQFGHKVTSTWRDGTVIQGRITKEFLSYITESKKPQDTDIYNKMTPFLRLSLATHSTVSIMGRRSLFPKQSVKKKHLLTESWIGWRMLPSYIGISVVDNEAGMKRLIGRIMKRRRNGIPRQMHGAASVDTAGISWNKPKEIRFRRLSQRP